MVEKNGNGIRGQLRVGSAPPATLYIYRSPGRCSRVPLARPRAQCLQLYESTTQPKTYACYLTSSAPNKGSYTQAIAPEPSSHIVALDLFKKFFRVKTGVAWEKRDCDVGEDEGLEPERIIWRYLAPAETPVPNVGLQTSIEKSAPEPVNEDIEW